MSSCLLSLSRSCASPGKLWGATLVNAAMYLGVTLIPRIARMYLLSKGLAKDILGFIECMN